MDVELDLGREEWKRRWLYVLYCEEKDTIGRQGILYAGGKGEDKGTGEDMGATLDGTLYDAEA